MGLLRKKVEYVETEINNIYISLLSNENTNNFDAKTFFEKDYKSNQVFLKARLEEYIASTYYSEMLKLIVGAFSVINIMITILLKNNLHIIAIIFFVLSFTMIYAIRSYSFVNKTKTKARYILSIMDSINQK